MNRSYSVSAQLTFDAVNKLQILTLDTNVAVRGFARLALSLAQPVARWLGVGHVVKSTSYGRLLTMPAEHFLPVTLLGYPQFNRPLGLTVEAIMLSQPEKSELAVVDVGANIGETVAVIEQRCPNKCRYLCIEPDDDLAELCEVNHRNSGRVRVERCCIGEGEGRAVRLEDDGRANPSVHLTLGQSLGASSDVRLMRLDTVVAPFAKAQGILSLIKVDTEGYDFSVLRSASGILAEYKPAIYFEWFPRLLAPLEEEVWSGFDFLRGLGYRHFVFFTSQGDFYCEISDPDHLFIRSLAKVTEKNRSMEYFDVCASTQKPVCDMLTELSIS